MSPASKYGHYQPSVEMILYEGEPEAASEAAEKEAAELRAQGQLAGIIDFKGDTAEAARSFFSCLRKLDKEGVDRILCVGVPEVGLGEAVMDRMRKAAGYHIVRV